MAYRERKMDDSEMTVLSKIGYNPQNSREIAHWQWQDLKRHFLVVIDEQSRGFEKDIIAKRPAWEELTWLTKKELVFRTAEVGRLGDMDSEQHEYLSEFVRRSWEDLRPQSQGQGQSEKAAALGEATLRHAVLSPTMSQQPSGQGQLPQLQQAQKQPLQRSRAYFDVVLQ
ncbi:MAG: hypothetical protein M1825_003916 [Sarcosagium campestre]|nr:MAG: hypothetical protein M1825_003916 [Sarcosagium campestre]